MYAKFGSRKNLSVNTWAIFVIDTYNDLHFPGINLDYSHLTYQYFAFSTSSKSTHQDSGEVNSNNNKLLANSLAKATITNSAGTIYNDELAITTQYPIFIESKISGVYYSMLDEIRLGNIDVAASKFVDHSVGRYKKMFQLFPNPSAVANQLDQVESMTLIGMLPNSK